MTTLDLTLLPLYRLNNQELPALPGLLAMTAPRKTARGRENDRLIVYLVLTGKATLSTAEYLQLTSQTASAFFETPGALTTALRTAVEKLNRTLLDRNKSTTGRGEYAVGSLVLAALRGANCTMLQSGPTHVYTLNSEAVLHMFDPALSGKGLGASQAITSYFTQTELKPGDRLVFAGQPPATWERALGQEQSSSIESIRRRLFSLSKDNVNAVIIRAHDGTGGLTVMRPVPSSGHAPKAPIDMVEDVAPVREPPAPLPEPESLPPFRQPDSVPQPKTPEPEPIPYLEEDEPEESEFVPSAYAIPPQVADEAPPEIEEVVPEFPASLPRSTMPGPETPLLHEMDEPIMEETPEAREPFETTRQVARSLVGGMQASRRMGDSFSRNLQKFLPSLLPGSEGGTTSATILMIFIAVVIPLLVVTAGSTVYLRYGRSYQYDNFYLQAESARAQAANATEPARQRDGWQAVLFYLDKAEFYRVTPDSESLRNEAQSNLDELLGIKRLRFYPAFSSGLNAQISRLAANESDLYMLDAENGDVLHARQQGGTFEMDEAFICGPGQYGDYQVGPLVDILILPRINSLNAAMLGIDPGGNLLYCSPGEVGQVLPLAVPDTNWGRVTGFTLDSGNLYVLDASSRAIWVYSGLDSSFIDRPFFFFGGQIPDIEDSIDLIVSNDQLYLLHADGHISTCLYSRLDSVPTRCEDPATLTNTIPAYQDIDLFAQSHLTQMVQAALPDLTLLFLDSDTRSVIRINARTLELQTQIYPATGSSFKQGPAGAMTVNPNRVLFMAIDDQVYFATDMP